MSVTPDTDGTHVDIFGSSKFEGSYVGDILYSEIQLRVASQRPKWTPPWTQSESESCLIMSGSLQPHGLYRPWTSPGQNTGVGSLSLLWGIFPTQESKWGLLYCRRILYQLCNQGNLWTQRGPSMQSMFFSVSLNFLYPGLISLIEEELAPTIMVVFKKVLINIGLSCFLNQTQFQVMSSLGKRN